MKKSKIILLVLFLSLTTTAFAGELETSDDGEKNLNKLKAGLGLHAGQIGGSGFSYLYLPNKGFGFRMGFIYLKSSDFEYFNFGVQPLFVLHKGTTSAMYISSGFGLKTETTTDTIYDYYGPSYEDEKTDDRTSFGVGLGWASFARGRFSNERFIFTAELLLIVSKDEVLPWPQVGFYYMLW